MRKLKQTISLLLTLCMLLSTLSFTAFAAENSQDADVEVVDVSTVSDDGTITETTSLDITTSTSGTTNAVALDVGGVCTVSLTHGSSGGGVLSIQNVHHHKQ